MFKILDIDPMAVRLYGMSGSINAASAITVDISRRSGRGFRSLVVYASRFVSGRDIRASHRSRAQDKNVRVFHAARWYVFKGIALVICCRENLAVTLRRGHGSGLLDRERVALAPQSIARLLGCTYSSR